MYNKNKITRERSKFRVEDTQDFSKPSPLFNDISFQINSLGSPVENSEILHDVIGQRINSYIKYSSWKCKKCNNIISVLQNEFSIKNGELFNQLIKPKQCTCGNKKLEKMENKYFPWEKTSYPLLIKEGKNGK